MRQKLQFIMDGGAVQRFHTVQTIKTDTVAAHSFGVAMLVHLMTNGTASAALLLAALTHDLAECQTGDIPAPAKRLYGLRETMGAAELGILTKIGFEFPELTATEKLMLKYADCLDGILFCVREARLGNREVNAACKNFKRYIAELAIPFDIMTGWPDEKNLRSVIASVFALTAEVGLG